VEFSPAPAFDLEEEFRLQQLVTVLIKEELIESAHDISEGGVFITLVESGFNRAKGFEVTAGKTNLRKDAFWFGEAQGRVVVTVGEADMEEFLDKIKQSGVEYLSLGRVTNGRVTIDGENWGEIGEWKILYDTAIENYLVKELESEGALGMI
jgi:phosphoribosylformylglycinamidine synthase